MKFCKDCKWCLFDSDSHLRNKYRFARCSHPKVSIVREQINPVSGSVEIPRREIACSIARKGGLFSWLLRMAPCGEKARLWEDNKNDS